MVPSTVSPLQYLSTVPRLRLLLQGPSSFQKHYIALFAFQEEPFLQNGRSVICSDHIKFSEEH